MASAPAPQFPFQSLTRCPGPPGPSPLESPARTAPVHRYTSAGPLSVNASTAVTSQGCRGHCLCVDAVPREQRLATRLLRKDGGNQAVGLLLQNFV